MSYRAAVLACTLLIPSLLTADVTLTYSTENKLSPSLPPAFAQTLGASHILGASRERKIAVSGGKIFANISLADMIADLPNDKLTLIDSANKHYVTMPVSQYGSQFADSIPKLPASMQALFASIKLTVDSKLTGRTAEIQGIQAEEHQIVLSLGIPVSPNAPLSPVMKIVIQLWRAKSEEIARNPALQEFVSSGFLKLGGTNPAEAIQKILSQFPAIADGAATFSKEAIDTRSITLRMHSEVFIPILAMLMPRAPAGASAAPAPDPNAPVMEINEELTSVSAAPIPDSTFLVPEGYTAVPIADFMSAVMPKLPAATPKPAPAPSAK